MTFIDVGTPAKLEGKRQCYAPYWDSADGVIFVVDACTRARARGMFWVVCRMFQVVLVCFTASWIVLYGVWGSVFRAFRVFRTFGPPHFRGQTISVRSKTALQFRPQEHEGAKELLASAVPGRPRGVSFKPGRGSSSGDLCSQARAVGPSGL